MIILAADYQTGIVLLGETGLVQRLVRIQSWQRSRISLIPGKNLIKPPVRLRLCVGCDALRCDVIIMISFFSCFFTREEKNAIRNKSSKIGDVIFWLDNVGTINTDKQKHPLLHMIRRPRLIDFHNSHAGISNPTIAFILVWYEGSAGQ